MNQNLKTLLLIGGGIYAFHLVRTALALLNINIKLVGARIHSIKLLEMVLRFDLAVTNVSSQPITLNFIDADIYVDGKTVGRCFHTINKKLTSKYETQKITFSIEVSNISLVSLIYNSIVDKNWKNHVFSLKGKLTANGVGFPFEQSINLANEISL